MPDTQAEPANTIRYCENCRWFTAGTDGPRYGICRNPGAVKIDDGARYLSASLDRGDEFYFASTMRKGEHNCGSRAKWFEAKIAQAAE